MTDAAGIEATLEDRPDLEPALRAVLDVDEDHDGWTYEDVPVDSGTFGELVSRGLVEDADVGYRLADPGAVRTVLRGDSSSRVASGEDGTGASPGLPTVSFPTVDRTTTALVAGALAFVALVRLLPLPSVYRNGDVVLSGNDPYHYRYWVEQALAASESAADFGALQALPARVTDGEPLVVATLWWLVELLGGSASTAGHVLAWYPVASAVVTAGLVYLLAVRTAADRRVGLAAVLVLAVLPGHALRTSLGYADHHAFDYPWLAATALALVVLATVDRDRLASVRTGLVGLGLGVAVAGQVLAWEAGPLLVVPVGIVVASRTLLDVHEGRSPLVAGAPVAAGLAVAAVVAWLVHTVTGWQTAVVAGSPALLFAGVVGVLLAAEGIHRTTGDSRHLAVVDALAVAGGVLAIRVALPEAWATLAERLGFLVGEHEAVETVGLFSPSSFGFLFLFGLTLVLALPMMAVGIRRSTRDGRWLVATVFAWYFLALAAVQTRFVGELGAFAALFAGLGFVRLAAWVEVVEPLDAEPPATGLAARASDRVRPLDVPDRRTLGALLALFVLFGAFGGMQTGIKTNQVVTEDATYETAVAIEAYAADRGQTYPDNYVLSRWGYNRAYNYFVNGEADRYAYAERTYEDFLRTEEPGDWYDRLRDRVGYVVLEAQNSPPQSMHARLYDVYGGRQDGGVAGLGHYRAIYVHDGGDRKAYALVPGARLTGTAAGNATVSVSTEVSVSGETFTYDRQTTAAPGGEYALRVAYPGEYTVSVDGESRSATVSERAVENGSDVTV